MSPTVASELYRPTSSRFSLMIFSAQTAALGSSWVTIEKPGLLNNDDTLLTKNGSTDPDDHDGDLKDS